MPCNESWIYCYDPETKRQSSQWKHVGSPRPKKARQSKSTHKLLMIPFFWQHWHDLHALGSNWTVNKHQFLSGIRDSKKAGSLWGIMRGMVGVRKSIHHSWLAKRLGLGLLCWGFKGVQEEIPSEEASTLQIGSVAFPPGQCTNSQLHPCHRLFHQDGHQDSSSPSLKSRPYSLWLLVIP